jgi:hypothetical protein
MGLRQTRYGSLVEFHIVVDDDDLVTVQGTFEELISPALTPFPPFLADGVESTDPVDVLSASRSVFQLANGGELVFEQSDGILRVASARGTPEGSADAVAWNDDYRAWDISLPDGYAHVDVVGEIAADDRAHYFAHSAIMLMGGTELAGWDDVPGLAVPKVAVVVIIVAIAAASVLACMLFSDCGGECREACAPRCVKRFKRICGVGYDFDGGLDWGFHCLCECTDCPEIDAQPRQQARSQVQSR